MTLAVAVPAASSSAAAKIKVRTGTYEVRSSAGQTIKMRVAACGKARCLSSAPSQGSENEIHLNCVNTSGGADANSDYEDYGPQRISPTGHIRTTAKGSDGGDKQTLTYSWTLTAKGTLTGTARLQETFADAGTCDSGPIVLKGHISK